MGSTVSDFDIVGSYDNQRTVAFNPERTVNMFEYIDPRGKRSKVLFPTSGLVDTNLNFTPETGGSRASFIFKDSVYQVFGGSIYKIIGPQNALTSVKIGDLTTTAGYVGIDANTFQIIFVDGVHGYIYDTNTGLFVQITDPGFPTRPIDACYLDGFFVVANGQTNNFQLSSFEQGLIWSASSSAGALFTFVGDPLPGGTQGITLTTGSSDYFQTGTPFEVSNSGGALPTPLVASTTYYAIQLPGNPNHIRIASSAANAALGIFIPITSVGTGTNSIDTFGQLQQGAITSHPGTIVACRTLHRRLFLFSQNFTEVWENAGTGTNLPFRRNNSLLMEVGTPSVGSISVGFDAMFFLSQDRDGLGSVMGVRGTESMPVSNRALDYQLSQYASIQINGLSIIGDARGIMIKENGIIFYRLNFTTANHTFVLNVSMSTPEEPRWHEEEMINHDRHIAQTHVYYNGVNYYGAYNSAKFYRVDPTVSTNFGQPIRRMRISRDFAPDGYVRTRIDRFQLDLLQGAPFFGPLEDIEIQTETGNAILTESGIPLILERQGMPDGGNPIIYLSVSKDGGQSYGFSLPALMGRIGERTFRTLWRKLGVIPRGQGFVVKIEFFETIPLVILGAAWGYEILPE